MHDSHLIAVASQVLTAFAVEVLKGFQEPFNPYLHAQTRPHPGQIEVAQNIRRVLLSSSLARPAHIESDPEMKLRQDRYCLRASPQWLGPQLEDLASAQKTMEIELNSTTDNPIIELEAEFMHHGANFMAMAVTSATEKMRLAIHHISKLMFAQLTDLLNHNMNCGLPPNLAVGEPSVDYSHKGVDVAAAAYLSEIAYLANPVSTHVNSAEMHNQSINSMALVSARYALETVKLAKMLLSTHIYTLCQAADLRSIEAAFRSQFFASIKEESQKHFEKYGVPIDEEAFLRPVVDRTKLLLNSSSDQDSGPRFEYVATELCATLIRLPSVLSAHVPISAINAWRTALSSGGQTIYNNVRSSFQPGSRTASASGFGLLGRTRMLYDYVRNVAGAKLHWGHPTRDSTTIGSEISKVFRAWDDPAFARLLVEILEGEADRPAVKLTTNGTDENGRHANGTGNGHGNGHANGCYTNGHAQDSAYAVGNGGGYVN